MPTDQHIAIVSDGQVRLGRTDWIAYHIPLERFVLRHFDGRWDVDHPVAAAAAKQHLIELGHDLDAVKDIIKEADFLRVYGVDVVPGKPSVFERGGEMFLNMYVPPALMPDPGEFPLIRELLATVTGGDEGAVTWLMHWLAAKYQQPEIRLMTAVVLQGGQGLGKTLLGEIVQDLLGRENCASIGQSALESVFNGAFARKLFVVADEVVDRENIITTSNLLKKYITDETILVNAKNVKQYPVVNRTSWLFTSNSSVPVRVEGEGDRRYSVFRGPSVPAPDYRDRLRQAFEGNRPTPTFRREMAAFAAYLRDVRVDRELIARPYENDARREVALAGRASYLVFFDEMVERSADRVISENSPAFSPPRDWDLGVGVHCQVIYRTYRHWCAANGFAAPVSAARLGQEMKLAHPEWRRVRVGHGARPWVYANLPRDRSMWTADQLPSPVRLVLDEMAGGVSGSGAPLPDAAPATTSVSASQAS